MKVASLASVVTLLLSCGGVGEKDHGWQPLHGTSYVTPKYGITFYWVGPGGKYQTPEEVSSAIDELIPDWYQIYEKKFGFALSREQRLSMIQRIDIQLFRGSAIRGNTGSWSVDTLGIWWPWNHQIDVAMAAPYHWDTGLDVWSEGLQVLRHEWTHVLQGEYHP